MFEGVRGDRSGQPPRPFAKGCLAVLLTTLASGGLAAASSAFLAEPVVGAVPAAAAGFAGSSLILAGRTLRSRRTAAAAAESVPQPSVPHESGSTVVAAEAEDRMMRVDLADLAEAIATARISRIIVPLGAGGRAAEAIALARRLASRRSSTVLVDFGAKGVAQEMGLIDAPADVTTIAASPTSFAHSIHRDRSSGSHVIAATIGEAGVGDDALLDAAATVLDALGEAYARTVVAIPADRFGGMLELIGADTAVVVPASSAGEPATRAILDSLKRCGVDDVLLVAAEREARRFAAA